MAKWKKKLQLWRNDTHLAHPTGGTESGAGSAEGRPAQQMPDLAGHAANETLDAAQSEENAFGIKLLVLGEAPTIE